MAEQFRRPIWKSFILVIAGMAIGIAILTAGFEAGRHVGYHWMTKPDSRLDWAASIMMQEQFTRPSDDRSESPRARLERYISQLGALDTTTRRWFRKRDFDLEMGLAYGKLALLEEQEGKAGTAKTLWAKAEEQMRKAQWKDPSRANVRRVIEHLEARNKSRPASGSQIAPR